ncbi:MAG: hypothetical protein ABIB41_08095, partial [Nitrospirota bacterium]
MKINYLIISSFFGRVVRTSDLPGFTITISSILTPCFLVRKHSPNLQSKIVNAFSEEVESQNLGLSYWAKYLRIVLLNI